VVRIWNISYKAQENCRRLNEFTAGEEEVKKEED